MRAAGYAAPVGQQSHPVLRRGHRTCLDDGSWFGDDGDADGCVANGGYQPMYCFVPAPPDVKSRNAVAVAAAAAADVADVFGVSCAVVSKAHISPAASCVNAADEENDQD